MPQRKNTREPGMLNAQNASDHQYAPLMSVEGIEPEVQSLTDESVTLNGTAQGVMTHLSLRMGSNSRLFYVSGMA